MSAQGAFGAPAGGPGGGRPRGPGAAQPFRAVLVVVVAVLVGVGVLARMSPPHNTAAAAGRVTTTVPRTTGTTSRPTTSSTTVLTSTTTTTTVPPASVVVLVLNGWTTAHAALYFQKKLAADGYDTKAPTNALSETNKTSTIFVVKPQDQANGLAIARSLGVPATAVIAPAPSNDSAVPASELNVADVIVLVGGDISTQVPPGYKG